MGHRPAATHDDMHLPRATLQAAMLEGAAAPVHTQTRTHAHTQGVRGWTRAQARLADMGKEGMAGGTEAAREEHLCPARADCWLL
mgnify:CR=1 FL=1